MQEKLEQLYIECLNELQGIGLDLSPKNVGTIEIRISKRNNKRYGVCKQEEPDTKYKIVTRSRRKIFIKYEKYNRHIIEISKWVLELNNNIIKNTIMHEIIHCFPFCSNHGKQFKMYAKYINARLGYNISRLGNKKEDYDNSNVQYDEKEQKFKYKIRCTECGKIIYRNRLQRNFFKNYRCLCGGRLELTQ